MRTLATQRRALGVDHEDTLTSINNLGTIRRGQGLLVEAELLYVEALEGRKRILGEDHPNTRKTAVRLASLYRDTDREEEALRVEMLRRDRDG